MRHRKRSRRLVGKWEHRKALLRNLLIALFVHERIKTTEAKAKELRRWADKMITLAKRGDLAARRQALSILPNKAVVRKLFSDLRERYAYWQSGFTRIVRIGPRRGDAAMMVLVELVTDKLEHKPSPKKKQAEEAALAEAPKPEAQEPKESEVEEMEAKKEVEEETEEAKEVEVKGEETPFGEAGEPESPEASEAQATEAQASEAPKEEAVSEEKAEEKTEAAESKEESKEGPAK